MSEENYLSQRRMCEDSILWHEAWKSLIINIITVIPLMTFISLFYLRETELQISLVFNTWLLILKEKGLKSFYFNERAPFIPQKKKVLEGFTF